MKEQERILKPLPSITPLVGLFGMVLGIVNGFACIDGTGPGWLGAAGPCLLKALGATLACLIVAVPVVIAYNIFCGKRGGKS